MHDDDIFDQEVYPTSHRHYADAEQRRLSYDPGLTPKIVEDDNSLGKDILAGLLCFAILLGVIALLAMIN